MPPPREHPRMAVQEDDSSRIHNLEDLADAH